ncbi:MAG TPA: hypothetical protein VKZ95_04820 [Sphingobacteriaceae bacterium]|nr:hypothetical protein [Sphingobacteriaceae bacterium]
MENVLITSGISAFAQRVAKLFAEKNLVFADSKPIPTPFINTGKYVAIPSPDKSSYVHEVLKVCLDLSINKVVPLGKDEYLPLARSKVLFEEYGIVVLLPDLENLADIPKLINPTRVNSPKIVLKERVPEDLGVFGIYSANDDREWSLCFVNE